MSDGQTAAKDGGSRAPDPLIGRVIADRFKIVSLIARGGMGKVYRAEQALLGRVCAIKVLNPNYNGDADPEFHRRFFREASITSKITHPNSVTIFDYGKTDDDIYFMAMEYLEGQTLHMALRDVGVMNELRVGKITAQICRALREAHKLGVIHRDLKPANIFLTRAGARPAPDVSGSMPPVGEDEEDFVKVLDFGLVKHLSERPEEQLTQTGLFMGSPKYMAPEQIQGGHVDERTDIYSLGIIMYEMLAGKVPFERATSVNILMAHVGEPPPPMRAVNPNLVCSPAFQEIVMSCIAKDPRMRISSMDALLQAIRRAHGGALTGQLPAVNMTGPFAPVVPSVPPAIISSSPTAATMTSASGSHSAMGLLRADASNDIASSGFGPPPRSKLLIPLGVLAAAIIGGGLGMLAFQWSEPPASALPAASAAASAIASAENPSPSAPSSETTPPSSAGAVLAATPTVKEARLAITTDPPGASVREDGRELCASTPCEIVFPADTAGATTHKLVVARSGYKPETRIVKTTDPPTHVKLSHAGGTSRPPAPQPSPAAKPDATTPSGFKDVPY